MRKIGIFVGIVVLLGACSFVRNEGSEKDQDAFAQAVNEFSAASDNFWERADSDDPPESAAIEDVLTKLDQLQGDLEVAASKLEGGSGRLAEEVATAAGEMFRASEQFWISISVGDSNGAQSAKAAYAAVVTRFNEDATSWNKGEAT